MLLPNSQRWVSFTASEKGAEPNAALRWDARGAASCLKTPLLIHSDLRLI